MPPSLQVHILAPLQQWITPVVLFVISVAYSSNLPLHPTPDSLDWHVAVRATQDLWLTSREGEIAIHGPGGIFRQGGKNHTLECLANREFLATGPTDFLVTDFVPMSACPGSPTLWKKNRKGWSHLRELSAHDILIAPWTRGHTLLVTVPRREGPPWGYNLETAEGGAVPRPMLADIDSSHGDSRNCYTRLQDPLHLWAFPSGDAFVVGGGECPEALVSNVVVEHWVPGTKSSRFDRLPLERLSAAIAPAHDNLWLAGPLPQGKDDWLVHYDGKGWTLAPNPISGSIPSNMSDTIRALAWQPATEDEVESLWMLSNSLLWIWKEPRMAWGGGSKSAFVLPADCQEPGALAIRDGHPWMTCGNLVYTTQGGIETVDWPFTTGAPCPRPWIRHGVPTSESGCAHHEKESQPYPLPPSLKKTKTPVDDPGLDLFDPPAHSKKK